MAGKLCIKDKDISGSKFDSLRMEKCRFENINLQKTSFEDVNFSDVSFMFVQFGGASFTCAGPPPDEQGNHPRQRPVRFEHVTLVDSTFEDVNFENARLVNCQIADMRINGVLVTDMLEAHKNQSGS